MVVTHTKKKILTSALTFLFFITSLTPVSAWLFSSKPDNNPLSNQHSDREDQINAYNDQAIRLFEEGRFKEAQELWEQAIELMERPGTGTRAGKYQEAQDARQPADEAFVLPEHEGEFGVDDVDELYETAVSLFKKQKYVASKKMFERVEAVIPDHKASRNYLTILDHKIKQAQQTLSGDRFRESAVARREERAEWQRILEESERELEGKLTEQAAPLYQEALQYYKSRAFKSAKDCFTEVARIFPGYKDTAQYLARIDADIREDERRLIEEKRKKEVLARQKEKEEWQRILRESEQELQKKLAEQAEPVYQEAVHYYKKRQFELAKSRFQEVEWVLPDYKSTPKYLERIDQDIQEEIRLRQQQRARELERQKREEEFARQRDEERLARLHEAKEQERLRRFQEEVAARRKEREEWLKILEESERERQSKLKEQADSVYREAVQFYKKRQFVQAKEDFLEAERILPDYKSTAGYMARIDRDIEEEEKQRLAEQQRMFQREQRDQKLAERRQREEEQQQHAVEEQNRVREFKEKALARKKQREEWERVLQENEKERQRKLEEEAEFVYQEAVRFYKDRQWEHARNGFLEAGQILPGHKRTEKYLARIDRDMKREDQRRREAAKKAAERQKREDALAQKREEGPRVTLHDAKEQEQIQQRRRQAGAVYKFAESLYKRGNYTQAKDKFLEAEQIFPGYTSASKYLGRIDADIAKDQERRRQEQQLAFERQVREQRLSRKQEEERLARLQAAEEKRRLQRLREEASARQKEREEWEKTVRQIEAGHQKRLRQQAGSIYSEALRYYKAGWLEQAKETFEEVEATLPGYKSTGKYLARIDRNIKKEEQLRRESEEKIQGHPEGMLTAKSLERSDGDISKAQARRQKKADAALRRQRKKEQLAKRREEKRLDELRRKEEKQRLEALKEEAAARRGEKESLKASLDKMEREHRKKLREQADPIYREALQYYRTKAFQQAKDAFIEVEKTVPGYKSTAKYLARIDEDIAREAERSQAEERRSLARRKKEDKPAEDRVGKWPTAQMPQDRVAKSDFPAPGKHGDIVVKEAVEERRENLFRETEEKYREALGLYKAKKFIEAKLKFIEVESLSPGFKATLDYLGRIDDDIQNQQALTARESGGEQKEIIQQALSREEDQGGRERLVQERRKALDVQRRAIQREYGKQFQRIYVKAVKLYRRGSYEEAGELFLQIERVKPGYKKAASYLEKAEAKTGKALQKQNSRVALPSHETKTRDDIVSEALNALEQKL